MIPIITQFSEHDNINDLVMLYTSVKMHTDKKMIIFTDVALPINIDADIYPIPAFGSIKDFVRKLGYSYALFVSCTCIVNSDLSEFDMLISRKSWCSEDASVLFTSTARRQYDANVLSHDFVSGYYMMQDGEVGDIMNYRITNATCHILNCTQYTRFKPVTLSMTTSNDIAFPHEIYANIANHAKNMLDSTVYDAIQHNYKRFSYLGVYMVNIYMKGDSNDSYNWS